MNRRLRYRDARTGDPVESEMTAIDEAGADGTPPGLLARRVTLENDAGTFEARLLWPTRTESAAAHAAHAMLDNEILAGLRLRRHVRDGYPAEVSELIGYEADGDTRFALLAPYRGTPCDAYTARLLPEALRRFQASLLTGVRLLAAAGIAHRMLNPDTVRWDGDRAQLTGFGLAAPHGETRAVAGAPPWSAPEQRPEQVGGEVEERDDLWAVGLLIHRMATGTLPHRAGGPYEELPPDLAWLLTDLFAPVGKRPSVAELLSRAGVADPVPHPVVPDSALAGGRAEFHRIRAAKHPETVRDPTPPPPPPPQPQRAPWWRPQLSAHWAWIGASAVALLVMVVWLTGRG